MFKKIEPSWQKALRAERSKNYFKTLSTFVKKEYAKEEVYPPQELIFNAFALCPVAEVRVVLLGQDPYHGRGQAQGLCFSVAPGSRIPPSLKNIYKEIKDDIGSVADESGDVSRFAREGVLLLNATLTVRSGSPGSHQHKGWEEFTDAVIHYLSTEKSNIVFILWGRYAREKGQYIDRKKHLVLTAPHPSPFSAHKGFLGCRHFSMTNAYLEKHGFKGICW